LSQITKITVAGTLFKHDNSRDYLVLPIVTVAEESGAEAIGYNYWIVKGGSALKKFQSTSKTFSFGDIRAIISPTDGWQEYTIGVSRIVSGGESARFDYNDDLLYISPKPEI
jgi:hypothetical protein